MQFDFSQLTPRDRYKLLVSTVVPRPIALVTSMNESGLVNAAPFSFFNVMGSDPAMIVIAPGNYDAQTPKDTARNIRSRGEFAVHIVDENLALAMNICAIDFPPGESEIAAAKLDLLPCEKIGVPRIAQSPVSLECREIQTLEIGRNRVVFGEVLAMHVCDDLVDVEKFYVHTEAMHAVGRMHGAGGYCTTRDMFQIPRISYEEWRAQNNNDGETPD